jgi:hypothetical protein
MKEILLNYISVALSLFLLYILYIPDVREVWDVLDIP